MRIMFDAVDVDKLPAGGALYAGYLTGAKISTTIPALRARFPRSQIVEIAVTASQNAPVADVENGDLTPADVPAWAGRQRARGVTPTAYANRSTWPEIVAACRAASVPAPLWWAARPGPASLEPGSIATQYGYFGGYDTSIVADFWPGVDAAPIQDGYKMLIFAVGLDALTAAGISGPRRVGALTTDVAEAQAAISRGEPVLAVGGPAAAALGVTPTVGQLELSGHLTLAVGATAEDTRALAEQAIR